MKGVSVSSTIKPDLHDYIVKWLDRYRPGFRVTWFVRALITLFRDDPIVRHQFCRRFRDFRIPFNDYDLDD